MQKLQKCYWEEKKNCTSHLHYLKNITFFQKKKKEKLFCIKLWTLMWPTSVMEAVAISSSEFETPVLNETHF